MIPDMLNPGRRKLMQLNVGYKYYCDLRVLAGKETIAPRYPHPLLGIESNM